MLTSFSKLPAVKQGLYTADYKLMMLINICMAGHFFLLISPHLHTVIDPDIG
jgi:hypothetical protein